ncbi:MAG: peptidase [Phycisphaeraceae bacterium]|nr:MAG: peptidase [Phycisphaeraceae bacterium]
MRMVMFAALAASVVCVGACSSGKRASDSGASGRLGAVDQSFRRPAGDDATNIFDPLDLPPANELRLGSGAPGPDYWQQQCDYIIDCALDAETKRLDAQMRVTYHNNSPHALDYMWIQLEQNLFRQDSTGTLSRGRGVMRELAKGFDGGYDIGSLRHAGSELEYSVYDTLARVELPAPIEPGETFVFELDYAFDMPPHLRRMGSEEVDQGTIFEYAQWFPHVCNYDDVNGWNALPYLGSGEFYTNFGDYQVNITVPRDHIVAATGTLTNPSDVLTGEQRDRLASALDSGETLVILEPERVGEPATRPDGDGPLTWRFEADSVRTFAWASSEAFIWDACGADVTDLDGTTRRVLCQSLYPKEAESWYWNDDGRGSSQVIKHSIEFYSDWLYPYPYPIMSNINGPEGGMEYPMIVFCGSRTSDRGMMGVTDHEVGHNWYPMLVNSDERRYMWQDEGFNSFINFYSKAAWYETDPDIDNAIRRTLQVMNSDRRQRIDVPPDRHWSRWIGTLNYRKTALALYLLREEVLGPDRFDAAFKTYTERWAFKHPQPGDFFRAMEDAAGADLAWFWRSWLLSDRVLDQGVRVVSADEDGVVVDLTNTGGMVMPVHLRVTFDDDTTKDVRLPVEVWATTDLWRTRIATDGKKPVQVQIDPEGVYPDVNIDDNTAPVK